MSLIHGTVFGAGFLANERDASVENSTSLRGRGTLRPWVSPISACWLVLGVLGACAGSTPPLAANPDPLDPSNTELAACVATTRNVPMDSLLPSGAAPEGEMLRIGRELPGGFTSIETDDEGGLILQMVDTLKASLVREALAIHLSSQTPTVPLPQMLERLAAARLQPVPWSLAQLYDWNRYLSSLVLPAAVQQHIAVFGSGVSTQHARVEIDLEGEAAREWVNTLLAPARVPCGLVHLNLGSTAPTKS